MMISTRKRHHAGGNEVEGNIDSSTGLRKRRNVSDDKDGDFDDMVVPGSTSTSSSTRNGKDLPDDEINSFRKGPNVNPPNFPTQKSVVPLSMQLMRPFWAMSCCPGCGPSNNLSFEEHLTGFSTRSKVSEEPTANLMASSRNMSNGSLAVTRSSNENPSTKTDEKVLQHLVSNVNEPSGQISYPSDSILANDSPVTSSSCSFSSDTSKENSKTNNVQSSAIPATPVSNRQVTRPPTVSVEQLLHEYTTACQIFGCSNRINPGILTTIRFSLPTLRVSGNFFDADMLALSEVLLKHCNGALSFISRLDFTIASKEGRENGYVSGGGGGSGKKGIRSHGAFALSKVLQISKYIKEVYLNGNRIGPYGASAIFCAVGQNPTLETLLMKGCRVRERGAFAFVKEVCNENSLSGLREVDLSFCQIGYMGCEAIEGAVKKKCNRPKMVEIQNGERVLVKEKINEGITHELDTVQSMVVDLEGNMVFQEVMNCVTHGLGILLGFVGGYLLTNQVRELPSHYVLSCGIYSASLIALYTSSTLFHSFFALPYTCFIFGVFDRCAIYILIAGSYTPFLMITLHHEPMWSMHLLWFIWACCIGGIVVEATLWWWKHKPIFSLAMYLGMGWCCLVCMPDLVEALPSRALGLLVAGGLAYTGGVPFFKRNNYLDHSIWHLFVLSGSIFHWLCVYLYVAKHPE